MLLIGSRALLQLGYDVGRVPRDIDLIASPGELRELVRRLAGVKAVYPIRHGKKSVIQLQAMTIEVEVAWPGSSAEALLNRVAEVAGPETDPLTGAAAATLDVLHTLKHSHRYLRNSPHFHKTRQDIISMRAWGATVPDGLRGWLKARENETYQYGHVSLEKSKAEFFRDAFPHDHDSLHEVMALGGVPAYTLYRRPGAEVQCDRGLWDRLPEEVRLASVVEEACVLALERSQIPFPGQWTPEQSFLFALEKACTSITSGWWREYAWEHYDAVVALWRKERADYVELFRSGLANGLVRPSGPPRSPDDH